MSGIIKGDEIMVINGAIVSDLDMMYLESVLQEELSLVMMMRYVGAVYIRNHLLFDFHAAGCSLSSYTPLIRNSHHVPSKLKTLH